jgi:hypothetical protein
MKMSAIDYDGVAEEVDDMPESLKEGMDEEVTIEGEDIHAAEQMSRSDVMEPAKDVEVFIKSIKVDQYVPKGQIDWKFTSIEPMIVIGEKGVDGKGKYKNKHFFPRILVAVNRKSPAYDFTVNAKGKPTDYYAPGGNAFGDYNAFLTALGFPTNPAPRNDATFRKSLVGRKLIVDITKDRRQVKDNVTGEYVFVNEYENKLLYKGQPKAAPKADVAEAAAS